CCGAGYMLTTLAFLHGDAIQALIGSDIDPEAVERARANVALLTPAGLAHRTSQLQELYRLYGKASHQAALASAEQLRRRLPGQPITARIFAADATDDAALQAGLRGAAVDVVLTDVPYGLHSGWQGRAAAAASPITALLGALQAVLSPASVVALASDKVHA